MPAKRKNSQLSINSTATWLLRRLFHQEVIGGTLLLVAAAIALIWANFGDFATYEKLWTDYLQIGNLNLTLRHWVNDVLMTIFFLLIGLEIKREVVYGELRDKRHATLPIFAAIGGMLVPALIYYFINRGSPGETGWAIPMATDIAFAVSVLVFLGKMIPFQLKIFVLALAIVDDIGAVTVISVFYTDTINFKALGLTALLILALKGAASQKRFWLPLFAVLGVLIWNVLYNAELHPAIAGALVGFMVPVKDRSKARRILVEKIEIFFDQLSSYFIVPLFALANAGVIISFSAFGEPTAGLVASGIILGLVFGKLIGITAFSYVAVKLRLAKLPRSISWRHIIGASLVAGIGFTISLYITSLSFSGEPALQNVAKTSIFIGSLISFLLGTTVLTLTANRQK